MTQISGPQTLKWKADVEFEGTLEEYKKFTTALMTRTDIGDAAIPTRIVNVFIGGKSIVNFTGVGYMMLEARLVLEKSMRKKEFEGAPTFSSASVHGINGGIRTPHLHLGDDIVLLDRETFKTTLGELARQTFEQRVVDNEDYQDIIAPLSAK